MLEAVPLWFAIIPAAAPLRTMPKRGGGARC